MSTGRCAYGRTAAAISQPLACGALLSLFALYIGGPTFSMRSVVYTQSSKVSALRATMGVMEVAAVEVDKGCGMCNAGFAILLDLWPCSACSLSRENPKHWGNGSLFMRTENFLGIRPFFRTTIFQQSLIRSVASNGELATRRAIGGTLRRCDYFLVWNRDGHRSKGRLRRRSSSM